MTGNGVQLEKITEETALDCLRAMNKKHRTARLRKIYCVMRTKIPPYKDQYAHVVRLEMGKLSGLSGATIRRALYNPRSKGSGV